MENMVKDLVKTYSNKRVFITGHTGFKGAWLVGMLNKFNSIIAGYSLPHHPDQLLYPSIKAKLQEDYEGNILDKEKLKKAILDFKPDIIFHLAAQALVIDSYKHPSLTYETNVMGTMSLLEAARTLDKECAVICVTTDKVYQNLETKRPFKETDRLGGYDIYSSSKAACELLVDSYRSSFFNLEKYHQHGKLVSTVRAGNVIGGGDWNINRLIPDLIKAAIKGDTTIIRSPFSVRPWQHVLDCLYGYLLLGQSMLLKNFKMPQALNFAPDKENIVTVEKLVETMSTSWEIIKTKVTGQDKVYHEAQFLHLDNSLAKQELHWTPKLDLEDTVKWTVDWYKEFSESEKSIMDKQINKYYESY